MLSFIIPIHTFIKAQLCV